MTNLVCLVACGDSIVASGYPPPGPSYFYQAFGFTGYGDSTTVFGQSFPTYYGTNLIARDMGISGTKLTGNPADFANLGPSTLDPLLPSGYTVPPFDMVRKYILTNAIGSNDGAIDGYGALQYAAYADAVATATAARKTAGYSKVGMCTLLPRNDGNMLEVNRLGYNSTIMGGGWAAARSIDYIIDLASEVTMGNFATCSDSTYYCQNGVGGYTGTSGLHPTAAGHALLAPIYLAGVNAMIALL